MATSTTVLEKLPGRNVTEEMMLAAAKLFSEHYGIWGAQAAARYAAFARAGRRIRITPARLREQCMPANGIDATTYSRILIDGKLVGNVFATHWEHDGRTVCWITQLVVDAGFRGQGLAKQLLASVRQPAFACYGILSSHAHACMAAVNTFGGESGRVLYEPRPARLTAQRVWILSAFGM